MEFYIKKKLRALSIYKRKNHEISSLFWASYIKSLVLGIHFNLRVDSDPSFVLFADPDPLSDLLKI